MKEIKIDIENHLPLSRAPIFNLGSACCQNLLIRAAGVTVWVKGPLFGRFTLLCLQFALQALRPINIVLMPQPVLSWHFSIKFIPLLLPSPGCRWQRRIVGRSGRWSTLLNFLRICINRVGCVRVHWLSWHWGFGGRGGSWGRRRRRQGELLSIFLLKVDRRGNWWLSRLDRVVICFRPLPVLGSELLTIDCCKVLQRKALLDLQRTHDTDICSIT